MEIEIYSHLNFLCAEGEKVARFNDSPPNNKVNKSIDYLLFSFSARNDIEMFIIA